MKNYRVSRHDGAVTIEVLQDNDRNYDLSADRSQKIRNHSPDGFEFGYGGSGPSQTALAILLDFTGDEAKALDHYQDFKWAFIANAPKAGRTIYGDDIEQWLRARPKPEVPAC